MQVKEKARKTECQCLSLGGGIMGDFIFLFVLFVYKMCYMIPW